MITLRRKYRSRRKVPLLHLRPQGRDYVAEMTRKSDRRTRVDPTDRNSFSCSTRNKLRLKIEWKFADFIKERRTSVGHLDQSELRPGRP